MIAAAAAALFVFLVWKVVKPYFLASPLDNIPGPSRHSLFLGKLYLVQNPTSY